MKTIIENNVKFAFAGKGRKGIQSLLTFRKDHLTITQFLWVNKKSTISNPNRKALIILFLN